MTVSLYRRYRPAQFKQIVAQDAAVQVITKALEEKRVSHAYLFSGPRGCGKTTLARLLAKSLNCTGQKQSVEPCNDCPNCLAINGGESLDVIEIDGASNNSVDEVRELKAHVSLSAFSSLYKVYIIDEVHMLSLSAFNALLKTLEEPPSHVVFILATTEPHKVPVTIRSRCQHIPFRKIDVQNIVKSLSMVAHNENRKAEEEALWEIARQADGAMRDALSLLEQVMALAEQELRLVDVSRLLGGGSRPELERWVSRVRSGDISVFSELQEMFQRGASPQKVVEDLFVIFRDLWIVASWGGGALQFIEGSSKEKFFLEQESKDWNPDHLLKIMDFCAQILPQVRMGMRSDVLSGLFLNKLIEHGSLVTKELEKTREPHSLPPEDHPAFKEKWGKVLASLLYGEIHIYCALLHASVFLEKNVLSLKFPDYCNYSMELVSIERNSFVLQQKIKEIFEGELTLRIICGDKTTECDLSQSPLLAEIEEAIVEIQDEPTSSLPFDDLPPTAEIRPEFGNEQEDDETVFSGLVDTVLRWGGGEVLLHKKDNVEELDGGITEE